MWCIEFTWRHPDDNYVSSAAIKLTKQTKRQAFEEAKERWFKIQKTYPNAQGPYLVYRISLDKNL